MKNPPISPEFKTKSRLRATRCGFTLIVTLVMMVLLTILALGLLNLSAITLRKGGVATASATARNNARLAMMLALAELQKQTGPDQRITATADMASADVLGQAIPDTKSPTNNTSVNSIAKGLSAVQPGTRYWTGVWKNTSTTPGTEIYTKTPSPKFLQWLISGNDYLVGSTINSPATPAFALKGDGSVSDKKGVVVLAGRSTIGDPNSNTLSRYISAPLVALSRKGKAGTETIGRYAWWVGDEGVKAKINLSPGTNSSSVATYQTLSTQRSGWETVTGFSNYPTPVSPTAPLLNSLVTLPEIELLDPSLGKGSPSPLGKAFHSATADSFGVIADTLNGGLRLDLSSYLSKPLPTTSIPNVANPPNAGKNIIPNAIARQIQGPKWDRLREFVDIYKSLNNGKMMVKAATQITETAISPTVVDLRVIMGGKLVPGPPNTTTVPPTDTYKVYPCAKVAIALANPYPYPLAWTSPLELEFKSQTPGGSPQNAPSRIWNLAGQPAFLPRGDGTGDSPSDSALLSKAIFRIPSDEIPPGEARAYTMGGTVVRPVNDMNTIMVDLRAFAGSDSSNFENSLQMIHNSPNDAPAGGSLPAMDVRESWTTSLLTAELRTGSNASRPPILRRIERFELDNGFYGPTQRTISSAEAKVLTKPFPLQLYSFQISQPGADYASLLPDPTYVGIRSSTLRTFADFNLQATRFRKPITSYNPPPYFMESTSDKSSLPVGTTGGDTGPAFTKNLAISPVSWGRSPLGTKKTILFSPPQTLVSMAQLQHADLTADDKFVSVGHQPGNAFGNSYATPFVKRNLTVQNRNDYTVIGTPNPNDATVDATNYYDISYLLNAAL